MLMSLFVSIKKETNDEDGGVGGARVDTRYSNDDDFVVVDFLRKSLSICGYPATKRRMQNSTCAQIIGQNVLSFPYLLILIWWPPRAKSTEEENNLLGAFFFLLRLIIVTECWWWLPSARSSVEWRRKKKNQTRQFRSALFRFWRKPSTENHIFATNLRNCVEQKSDVVGVGRTFLTTLSQRNFVCVWKIRFVRAPVNSQESRQIMVE